MDVFFLCEPSTFDTFTEVYKAEINFFRQKGFNVSGFPTLDTNKFTSKRKLSKGDKELWKVAQKRATACDFIFADLSYPTVELSKCVADALLSKIPVFAVYCEDKKREIFPFFLGYPSEMLVLKSYNIPELISVLENGLSETYPLIEDRLTITIPSKISEYLSWKSMQKKTSRSTLVKSLIEEKLRKDTKYKTLIEKEAKRKKTLSKGS